MFWSRNASPKPLKDPVPLELQLEVRGPSTNVTEHLKLPPYQRAFSDIIRLPHASYQVVGHVMPNPGQGGGYILSVIVGNHPAHKSPVGIDKPVSTTILVSFNSRYPIGKLQDDEFFVTLTRVDEAAASDTKTPVQVWWLLPLVVIVGSIAGYVWALKRPGPRMAGLGTGFMGASVLLFAGFLAQMMHVFDRIAQNVMALDAEGLASGIETAQATALLGVMVFLAGAVSAGLALFKYRYRALWFHRVLVAAGILMLFLVPVGTVLGVLLLVYVSNRRGEFGAEQMGTTTPLGNGAASPTGAPHQSEAVYAKTIRQGLCLAFGLFLGNWIGVPMIQKGKTFGDGFAIGCIAFLLVMVIYGIIAMVQSRNAESNRLGKSQNRE
jgi:hypothetical protein